MQFPATYAAAKMDFLIWSGLTDPILHMHAGLIVFLLAAAISRKSLGSAIPIAAVLLATIANEVLDWLMHGSWRPTNSAPDLFYTLLWPTILWSGARSRLLRTG
jgi:hypothetical protein